VHALGIRALTVDGEGQGMGLGVSEGNADIIEALVPAGRRIIGGT